MLFSVDSQKYIKTIPHEKEFNSWMKRLSQIDYEAIANELNNRIDGSDIETSSWIPGNNWNGTVFQPIYVAVGNNIEASGLFFGLILFDLMMKRPDVWGFGKYEKNGVPIKGITYFLLKNPPPYK